MYRGDAVESDLQAFSSMIPKYQELLAFEGLKILRQERLKMAQTVTAPPAEREAKAAHDGKFIAAVEAARDGLVIAHASIITPKGVACPKV